MFRKQYDSFDDNESTVGSWVIVIVILLSFIVGIFFFMNRQANDQLIDKSTFCEDGNLPMVTMVLVDASDALDPVRKERAIAMLMRETLNSPARSRADIYIARANGESLIQPIFSICNPGKAGNMWVSDAAGDKKKFEEDYLGGLERAFDEALGKPPSRTSPILESIRETSTKSFARVPNETIKRVFIVSDMLQNSDLISHYRGIGTFETFKASSAWPNSITDLHGAKVTFLYITRPTSRSIQGVRHQTWWENYITAVNGRLYSIESF